MFNLIDIITLAVILISAFVGYKRGLVKTAFSLLSFFIAIGVALLFYKPLALILTEKTTIDDWIIDRVENNGTAVTDEVVEEKPTEVTIEEDTSSKDFSLGEMIDAAKQDGFAVITNTFSELPNVIVEKFDVEDIKANAKHSFALKVSELIMNLLSLIAIYIVVKITLIVAGFLLNGLMEMPVLKQVNEVLGMIIGGVLGFVEMYIVFAIFTFVSSITNISFIIDAIKASAFASILFENNLVIKFLF